MPAGDIGVTDTQMRTVEGYGPGSTLWSREIMKIFVRVFAATVNRFGSASAYNMGHGANQITYTGSRGNLPVSVFNVVASKISGALSWARLPIIAASKFTSGIFTKSQVGNNIPPNKITSGTFQSDRFPAAIREITQVPARSVKRVGTAVEAAQARLAIPGRPDMRNVPGTQWYPNPNEAAGIRPDARYRGPWREYIVTPPRYFYDPSVVISNISGGRKATFTWSVYVLYDWSNPLPIREAQAGRGGSGPGGDGRPGSDRPSGPGPGGGLGPNPGAGGGTFV